MNELNTYIASGILEAYCLGSLPPKEAAEVAAMAVKHPEIEAEIDGILAALEQYPQGPEPAPGLKNQVLDFLDAFLRDESVDLQNLPLIHRHSDTAVWNKALANVQPDIEEPGFAARVLKETDDLMLSVVWLSSDLVEDEHTEDEFLESFFILEGACECDFDGKVVRFSAGDYFDIPPNTRHVIKNISEGLPFVKGLVQRRKAA
ncbi:MAG: cupin domain-containing protein [Saprospiraceae bacterium]